MRNKDIQMMILDAGLKKFRVAEAIGIEAATFSRWLQTEMSPERKQRVVDAINKLKGADEPCPMTEDTIG